MSPQQHTLELANERLRSHELPAEAITWITSVLEPEETPQEILVGVSSSSHRDARPVLTDEQIQASDFETVVLTDERVMFLHDQDQHEIPLSHLRNLTVGDGMSLARVTFYTGEVQRCLEQVNVEDARRFAEVARDQLGLPVRLGTREDISDFRAHRELEDLDALRQSGLISEEEWTQMRRPILARLGLTEPRDEATVPQKPRPDNSVRNAALVVLMSLAALLSGALIMFWALSGDDSVATTAPESATDSEDGSVAAASSSPSQIQVPAPSEETSEDEDQREATEPEASPTAEPSEEVPDASEAEEPQREERAGDYSPASQQAFEEAIGAYFTEQSLNTIAGVEFSPERILVSLEPGTPISEEAAIDVSADLAILIAQDNEIIDEPTHDARVSVPVDSGGVVAVNFDREAGQYTQVRE